MVFYFLQRSKPFCYIDVYKKAADYVRNFEAGKRDMTKYIIGTIMALISR